MLNQVVPGIVSALSGIFGGELYLGSGWEAKAYREGAGLPKTHYADAYCIGCVGKGIAQVPGMLTEGDGYKIRQFRRHDRILSNSQPEWLYYLDGFLIAKNRRLQKDKKESLSGWFARMEAYGRAEAERMRSRLTVKKSYRRYNNTGRMLPGAESLYGMVGFHLSVCQWGRILQKNQLRKPGRKDGRWIPDIVPPPPASVVVVMLFYFIYILSYILSICYPPSETLINRGLQRFFCAEKCGQLCAKVLQLCAKVLQLCAKVLQLCAKVRLAKGSILK